MSILLTLGIVIGAWALLNLVGSEQVSRARALEKKVKSIRPAPPTDAPPASAKAAAPGTH